MWPQLVGMGLSAIGSFFGKDDEEQVVKQTVDYEAMAESASKAGFNPLTAIRNGGSAGFTNTIHPALSNMAGFGSAFSTLGNALMSFDARADERAELETQIQRATLEGLNRSNAAAVLPPSMIDPPHAAAPSRVSQKQAPLSSSSAIAPTVNAADVPGGGTGTFSDPYDPYIWVWVDGKKVRLPNQNVVGDIENLGTIPAASGASDTLTRFGVPGPLGNPRPQGNPKSSSEKSIMDYQLDDFVAVGKDASGKVKQYFKPWETEWFHPNNW